MSGVQLHRVTGHVFHVGYPNKVDLLHLLRKFQH